MRGQSRELEPAAVRRWRAYPAYKPSGVPWLGDVPGHWTLTELEPVTVGNIFNPPPEEVEQLSSILKALNERFGTDFTEDDKVFIQHLDERLAGDAALEASVKVNVPENARLTFNHVANDRIQEVIDSNFKFYKQITDDPAFEEFFLGWLFERYSKTKKEAG